MVTLLLPRLTSGMTNGSGYSRLLVGTLPAWSGYSLWLVGTLPTVGRDPPDHQDPKMVGILSLSGRDPPDQGALFWAGGEVPYLAGVGRSCVRARIWGGSLVVFLPVCGTLSCFLSGVSSGPVILGGWWGCFG